MLDFFNEILSLIQRIVSQDDSLKQNQDNNDKYYHMDVDQYFSMCIYIAKHFHISPKMIYETWPLPMMIVTYADVHNSSLNNYTAEQEYIHSKVKHNIDAKNEFIRNITVDMLNEMNTEQNKDDDNKQFDEVHNALLEFYGGK